MYIITVKHSTGSTSNLLYCLLYIEILTMSNPFMRYLFIFKLFQKDEKFLVSHNTLGSL